MEKGDLHVGFGIMGGFNQPLAHAQFVSNIVDYGMNLQAALEAPRFTKLNATGCDVSIEMRVPAADAAAAFGARAPDPNPARVHAGDGARAGDYARFEDRREFRGIRSASGWVCGAGADSIILKPMAIVAGVDFGTLSVRVSIVDSANGRLGSATAEYPLTRKRDDPDHATQSHADQLRALTEAMRKALDAAGVSGDAWRRSRSIPRGRA